MKTTKLKYILLLPLCLAIAACSKKTTVDPGTNGGGDTGGGTVTTPVKTDVKMWLTTADRSQLLSKQNIGLLFSTATNSNTTINVDTTQTYQSIDGFGFALTGGSAFVINALPTTQRDALLTELFSPSDSTAIGISYIRITIGASDMSAAPFTYDDVPSGSTDVNLASFSISPELTDLIPVLKKIISINPSIKILACPWTPPVWMKVSPIGNNGFEGGSLNTAYYATYAQYFVKYIQAMRHRGLLLMQLPARTNL